jgi:GTP cyclohydrolase IIa
LIKMKKIQLTLIQIDNYGPWTVTPEPRREADLQTVQAELFADVERAFAAHGGLVFQTRSDNMLAISNGIGMRAHRMIQNSINDRYPFTISMGVGASSKPQEAQQLASRALQKAGSSRAPERRGVLVGTGVEAPDEDWVQIAHIDVDRMTMMTDTEPIYDTYVLLQRTYLSLISAMLKHGGLVFYCGGDNFMALSNGIGEKELQAVIEEGQRAHGVGLKASIGGGPTAYAAAKLAAQGLLEVRENRDAKRIVFKG